MQTTVKLPLKFVDKHYLELGEEWIITDPVGNDNLVRFNRSFAKPLLTLGWSSLIKFYGLKGTHWCVMNFKGNSQFDIVIYNDIIGEIQYHNIPAVVLNPNSLNLNPLVIDIDLH